jgi:malate dehydrogenase (quinone)
MAGRLRVLQDFYPDAKADDWRLQDAGIRVQAIKKTDGEAGIVHYGTEIITSQDRSISALLGASPGASVATSIAMEVIDLCQPHLLATPGGRDRMKEMVPALDQYFILPENASKFKNVQHRVNALLELS